MAIVACTECGKDVSDAAKSCPHCGKDMEGVVSKINRIGGNVATMFFVIGLIFAAAVFFFAIS